MYMYATRKQGLALALASIPAHLLRHLPRHYIQGAQMQTPFNMHCATHHSLRPHKPLLNHLCSHPSFLNNCTHTFYCNLLNSLSLSLKGVYIIIVYYKSIKREL